MLIPETLHAFSRERTFVFDSCYLLQDYREVQAPSSSNGRHACRPLMKRAGNQTNPRSSVRQTQPSLLLLQILGLRYPWASGSSRGATARCRAATDRLIAERNYIPFPPIVTSLAVLHLRCSSFARTRKGFTAGESFLWVPLIWVSRAHIVLFLSLRNQSSASNDDASCVACNTADCCCPSTKIADARCRVDLLLVPQPGRVGLLFPPAVCVWNMVPAPWGGGAG